MGPNGAGKSTLVKTLTGESQDYDGAILLAGKALQDWSDTERALRLAYVPQHIERGLSVDVLDYVLQGRYAIHGGRPERPDYNAALQALEECDVATLALHDVLTCSGGELRRIAIARAIAQLRHTEADASDRVIVLDEPTAHLDPRHAATVAALLRTLAVRSGWTVLTVLHDIPLALRYGHSIAVLVQQRLPLQR
jgi:iron complex transport system ATP-binding protein